MNGIGSGSMGADVATIGRGRNGTADRPLRIAVVASVAWMLMYTVLTGLSHGSPAAELFVGDLLYLVPIIAGVIAAAFAVRRSHGRHRTLWQVLTVAYAAQLVGEAVWTGYDYLGHDGPPQPSVADLGYLTASALAVVAILVGFGGAGLLRHLRGLLDSTLVIVGLGALGWQLLIRPQLTDGVHLGDLVNVAYPLLDIVLLTCLGLVGVAGHRSVPLTVRLVGLAGAVNAGSDIVYTYLAIFSEYDSGSWVDVAFEAAAVCSFLAAMVAVRRPERPAERRSFDRDLALMPILISLAAAFALVVLDKERSGVVGNLTLVVVGILFITVLLRQYLFAADRAALADDLRQAVREQHRLAITDGLTGLYNRRYLTTTVDRLRATATGDRPVSLMVIDLDHFKLVNDTYGHPAGDAVLQEAAARIAASARATDVVARYGGEEFVVLLTDTDAGQAEQLAERVRRSLRDTPIAAGGALIEVTASIGVASSPQGAMHQLLECADQALYRAKAQGRDRVTAVATPARETVAVTR